MELQRILGIVDEWTTMINKAIRRDILEIWEDNSKEALAMRESLINNPKVAITFLFLEGIKQIQGSIDKFITTQKEISK